MSRAPAAVALRRSIWPEVIAHGLCPGPADLAHGLAGLAACGRMLVARELTPRFGARLPGLYGPHADPVTRAIHGRVAAFSYLYAQALQRALGREPNTRASVAAALLSIAVCGIDRVLDGDRAEPIVQRQLATLADPARLARLLPADGTRERLDHHELEPQLVPCFAALDAFFDEAALLLAGIDDRAYAGTLRDELIALIHEAATAELATTELRLAKPHGAAGDEVLRAANTLPQWIVATLVLAAHPRPAPGVQAQLARTAEAIAEMMWILDDLADAADDLAQGRWSRTWTRVVAIEPGVATLLARRDPAALEVLARSGVIGDEVTRLEQLLVELRACSELADAGTRELRQLARVLVWSWLVPEVISTRTTGDVAAV